MPRLKGNYKLVQCQTCQACAIEDKNAFAPYCNGAYMKNLFELDEKPIAAFSNGKWNVANVSLEEPRKEDYPGKRKSGFKHALNAYHNKMALIIQALVPAVDDYDYVDPVNAREFFSVFIEQVCIDSIRPNALGADRKSQEKRIINDSRSYVFSQEFEDLCGFVSVNVEELRKILVNKWAKNEPPMPRMNNYRRSDEKGSRLSPTP